MEACSLEWQERLSAWFDGEADVREQAAVAMHLAACAGCSREAARYRSLRDALKTEAAASEAPVPEALRRRVSALVRPAWPTVWRRKLLAGAVAAAASVGVFWTAWPGGFNDALAMDLERHHLKAFSRTSPCDFESSDPQAVKAWVEREVGYSVEVPVVPGATLLGARRCQLGGQLTASLQYRYGDRAMTLFLPPPGSAAARQAARFADDGPRCTQGPVGERICVAPLAGEENAAVAVSELDSPVLLETLALVRPAS